MRVVRMLLVSMLLLAGGGLVKTSVKAEGGPGDSDCTGTGCPCVYVGGPEPWNRVCPA